MRSTHAMPMQSFKWPRAAEPFAALGHRPKRGVRDGALPLMMESALAGWLRRNRLPQRGRSTAVAGASIGMHLAEHHWKEGLRRHLRLSGRSISPTPRTEDLSPAKPFEILLGSVTANCARTQQDQASG